MRSPSVSCNHMSDADALACPVCTPNHGLAKRAKPSKRMMLYGYSVELPKTFADGVALCARLKRASLFRATQKTRKSTKRKRA